MLHEPVSWVLSQIAVSGSLSDTFFRLTGSPEFPQASGQHSDLAHFSQIGETNRFYAIILIPKYP